jgi:tetratricopeptide (TPR) repeat protein
MELRDRAIALYGRFSPGARERLERSIIRQGGTVTRDLTRRSDCLVIGSLATPLVDSGALAARLRSARDRGVSVLGERAFAAALSGKAKPPPTLPLATALGEAAISADELGILAAFDLIQLTAECVAFGDKTVLQTAAELVSAGRTFGDVIRILCRTRDISPRGRHRLVLTNGGATALQWTDGLTSLEGQGLLPFDEANATLDDLFEAASVAEGEGHLDQAAHLYDLCVRADRKDAIAAYNMGNIRLAQGAHGEAALAYQQALARDPKLTEARYNLAQALEEAGKIIEAREELTKLLVIEPGHADALFNLAQLQLVGGEAVQAKELYERYLALGPPEPWAVKARRAIRLCEAAIDA